MTEQFLSWLRGSIESGNIHPFYVSAPWRQLSAEVLRMDRYECQICKANKRYRKAVMVHHVNHVKRCPGLALDIWYVDSDGVRRRNLISVCRRCHEIVCHPERIKKQQMPRFETVERWD